MRKITPSLILILLCIFYAFPALADSTCSDNNDNGYCIQIITPTEANQKYDVGDSLEITWLQQKIDKVTIGYKTCPSCLDWISYNLAVNPSDTTGSFTWKIPERLNGKKDLQIYLIGYNTGVGSETSTSNNFSITEASDSTDDTLETTPSQEEQTSAPDQIPNPETPSEETTTSPTEEAPTTTEPVTTLPPNSLNDHFKGDLNAPVTIIEYGDYECPFCKQFHQQTLPLIEKEYIQTGKVKLIFKHFPLAEIHKNAQKASEAAECASNQGKFWEYHNLLFENTNNLDEDSLNNFADKTNLNLQEFSDCLKGGKERTSVEKNHQEGIAAGVSGTPTFLINGQLLQGARPYESFKEIIENALAGNTITIEVPASGSLPSEKEGYGGFRFAYWQCYDKAEQKQGGETSCKSSEVWQQYAQEFCQGHCYEDLSKCGVNSFSVSRDCSTSLNQENPITPSETDRNKDIRKEEQKEDIGDRDIREEEEKEVKEETNSLSICTNSCSSDGKCYPFGYRKAGTFCFDDGSFKDQLKSDESCENNFECSSNLCIDSTCVSQGFLKKIIELFKAFFYS